MNRRKKHRTGFIRWLRTGQQVIPGGRWLHLIACLARGVRQRVCGAVVLTLLLLTLAAASTMTVTVSTDRPSYSPGATVKVTAVARYDDGTPVTSVKSR